MDIYQKAVFCLLKFADQPGEATKLAGRMLEISYVDFHGLLTAAGAFAKDNESYFLRYMNAVIKDSNLSDLENELATIEYDIDKVSSQVKWITFRKPNEPRMRAAYEVLAGWVIKFLYSKKGIIPIDFADGQGRVWGEVSLDTEETVWSEFLEWMPLDIVVTNVGTLLDLVRSRMGTLQIPAPFMKTLGKVAGEMAIRNPQRFQNSISFNGGKGLIDLITTIKPQDLMRTDLDLAESLESSGVIKMDIKADAQGNVKSRGGDLPKAVGCLRKAILARVIADRKKPTKRKVFEVYCRKRNIQGAKFKQLLADLEAMERIKVVNGLVTSTKSDGDVFSLAYIQSVSVETKPPFSLSAIIHSSSSASRCLSCESPNVMSKGATKIILPESKKVWYERPKTEEAGDLCPECFYAALISGFYPSEAYSVCELPIDSSYQMFLLAQRLSNVTAAMGAMSISRSPLLTVLPSKYFLVRLSTGKGAMPKKAQLYLLLADYSYTFQVEFIKAHIEEAGAINFARVYVDILKLLGLFKRGKILPYYFVTDGHDKARTNDCIRLLESGKPYSAFYRLFYGPYHDADKRNERFDEKRIFKSPNTLDAYDQTVQECAATLFNSLWKGGEIPVLAKNPKEFYEDIRLLSDKLFDLLQPIAKDDVEKSKSNVSVVVRKYTDAVEKRFPQLNLVELQYLVAKAADDAEKRRERGETVYVQGKDKLSETLNQLESIVTSMYSKYFEGGDAYLWEEFIKEVNQRLLARLLLGVRSAR